MVDKTLLASKVLLNLFVATQECLSLATHWLTDEGLGERDVISGPRHPPRRSVRIPKPWGFHDTAHGRAILPTSLRWLWRDWRETGR